MAGAARPRDDGEVIDLNADLGEQPGDLALMGVVTSANVACGGHVGDDETMARAAALALDRGVAVGAHPSYPDRDHFGRRAMQMAPGEIAEAVAEQVERLAAVAAVRYVKLHGALYHRANEDEEVAAAILEVLPVRHVLSQPGRLTEEALARGFSVTEEGYCDRAYRPDGRLVGRDEPGSVLSGAEVVRQAVALSARFRSLCVHGDTPGALELAIGVRRALEEVGHELAPFA